MLAGKLTTSERQQLMNERAVVNFLSRQWRRAPKAHIEDEVAPQVLLNKIMARCWGESQPAQKNTRIYRIGYSVAAAVVLFIMGFWIANSISSSYIYVSAPVNDRLAIMLPDSSEVWLNAASQLRYRKSFRNKREIFLDKGEAFFKVRKAQGAPFKVYFYESMVEVTGTEFNIRSGKVESEIILFSGAIQFQADKGKEVLPVNPSERIVYNAEAKSITRTHIDATEYDWRSDKYRFTNKPLQEFIDFINRSYQVHILIEGEKLKDLKFNGTIHKEEPLSNILEKLCISLDLKMKQENNNILLY